MREHRPLTLNERKPEIHRIWDRQNVRKQNSGIQSITINRLQRHFCSVVRILRKPHKAAGLNSRAAVLRQISTCLTHQPERSEIRMFALKRTQEAVILRDHFVFPFICRAFRAVLRQQTRKNRALRRGVF